MNPTATTKVSISLPTDLYVRLEAERERRKVTRSALFAELALRLVREREHEERVARETAAYAKYPEAGDDTEWVVRAGAETLAAVAAEDPHDWSADYRRQVEREAEEGRVAG